MTDGRRLLLEFGPLPLVALAPERELDAAVRGAPSYGWVSGLVEFVGDGRKLTDRGNLTIADGKVLVATLDTGDSVDEAFGDIVHRTRSSTELRNLDLAFRMALDAGFLDRTGRSKVRCTPDATLLLDRPLEASFRLFLALLQIGPITHDYAGDAYGWWWFADDVDSMLLQILADLYGSSPVSIEEIGQVSWDSLLEAYDLDDVEPHKLEFHRGLVVDATRRTFDHLEDLGLIDVAAVSEQTTTYGFTERSGGTVALSALGTWAMERLLSSLTAQATGPTGAP